MPEPSFFPVDLLVFVVLIGSKNVCMIGLKSGGSLLVVGDVDVDVDVSLLLVVGDVSVCSTWRAW